MPRITRSPRASRATGKFAAADAQAGQALTAYAASDWAGAAARAKACYDQVLAVAAVA